MNSNVDLQEIGAKAKEAHYALASASSDKKNRVLTAIGTHLTEAKELILLANREDLSRAKVGGLSESMLERLSLQNRFPELLADIKALIALPDPIGEVYESKSLPNGLEISKMRTSIGVLGVIYESRPNVTVDVSMLAIKSGNCAILRGGSETINTNKALVMPIQKALSSEGLPIECIQLIESTDRKFVEQLLQLHAYVDLIIPRGSNTLQQFCRDHSTIPVITGGIGICHLYVEETAKLDCAIEVITNSKVRRPTVCNSLDTLLVQETLANHFIPLVISKMAPLGVSFKLDERAMKCVDENMLTHCQKAVATDWDQEWLNLTLGLKVVKELDEAVAHIRQHSTNHSDGILTENKEQAIRFINAIDSAAVYVNASTCFTDGGQFGLGGEVAISTQKLHARGPMGPNELTSYKWVVHGNYQTRP
ncbi:MAG: glutamate-5-semialdehyde dehydrogenase [Parachlamydiaceae bacterium]|nr:glutamate-5-semialdehyde dehydrogenase [Parachlamydiaceae bacterium]